MKKEPTFYKDLKKFYFKPINYACELGELYKKNSSVENKKRAYSYAI